MKALVLEANGRLRHKDVPRPQVAPDECLLAVRAAGVCSSDIPRAFAHGAYHFPLIMGHEFAGEVVACGAEVTDWTPGQQATVFPLLPCYSCAACDEGRWAHCRQYDYYGSRRDGAFAEFVAVKNWNLKLLPTGCDVTLAALCEPLAVCVHTLRAIPPSASGRLAIVGAGFMGLCLGKLAQRSGRFEEIFLFDRNPFKIEIAAGFGFRMVLLESSGVQASELAESFAVVIEACGAVETYRLALTLCAHGGDLVWMGNIAGDLTLQQKVVSSVLRREVTIHGVWNSIYRPGTADDWTEALAVISEADWLPGLITQHPTLAEGEAVLAALQSIKQVHRPHSFLKVCFRF